MALLTGDWNEAIALLRDFYKRKPDIYAEKGCEFMFAYALFKARRYKESFSAWKKAGKAIPAVEFEIAVLRIRAALKAGEFDWAQTETKRLIAPLKRWSSRRFRLAELQARVYQASENYAEEIKIYRTLLNKYKGKKKKIQEVLYNAGEAYRAAGKGSRAALNYQKSLEKNTKTKWARLSIEGIEKVRSELKTDVELTAEVYRYRAEVYFHQGNYSNAIRLFRKAIKSGVNAEEKREARFRIARAYYRNKDYSQAAKEYRSLIKRYGGDHECKARMRLARCYCRLSMDESARDQYEYVTTNFKRCRLYEEALVSLAGMYEAEGDRAGAAKIFERLEKRTKSEYADDACWRLARRDIRAGDWPKVADRLERASTLYSRLTYEGEMLFFQARALEELGMVGSAADKYVSFLLRYPRSFYARQIRERLTALNQKNPPDSALIEELVEESDRLLTEGDYQTAAKILADLYYRYMGIQRHAEIQARLQMALAQWPEWGGLLAAAPKFDTRGILEGGADIKGTIENKSALAKGIWFLAHGFSAESRQFLRQARRKNPKDSSIGPALIDLFQTLDQPNCAVQVAESILNQLPGYRDLDFFPIAFARALYPVGFEEAVLKETKANDVDPHLIFGLILAESRFQEDAKSYASAYGLMQIIPATGREIMRKLKIKGSVYSALSDPATNIRMGVFYFAEVLGRFDGRIECAAAAYNAGPTPVRRWLKRTAGDDVVDFAGTVTYNQTRSYVKKLLFNQYAYRKLYPVLPTADDPANAASAYN